MVSVNLYSKNPNELQNFLKSFYNSNEKDLDIENSDIKDLNIKSSSSNFNLKADSSNSWKHEYSNPIEVTDIIAAYIDNSDKYKFAMWISLDADIYISVTEQNANNLIKYLFERYPY